MVMLVIAVFWASRDFGQAVVPGGSAFGQYFSRMALGHPRDHGRVYGECVSAVARVGICTYTAFRGIRAVTDLPRRA